MKQARQLLLETGPVTFFPTAAGLHKGDVIEGHSGRAFPRKRTVLGVTATPEGTQVIYRERVAGDDVYGVMLLDPKTLVDLAPPF